MDFEKLWPDLEWVIDELKDGMSFFEGYVTSIAPNRIAAGVSKIDETAVRCDYHQHLWSSDVVQADQVQEYSPEEYERRFREEQIVLFCVDYEKKITGNTFNFKLVIEENDAPSSTSLEILCYGEAVLNSSSPKAAIEKVIPECCDLCELFEGDALFIGPDTIHYPRSKDDKLQEWTRIK